MKFIRESNIPAFQGKTWKEKMHLRRLAQTKDKKIIWLNFLFGGVVGGLVFPFSIMLIHFLGIKEGFLPAMAVFLPLVILMGNLYSRMVINPRIMKALETEDRTSASSQ